MKTLTAAISVSLLAASGIACAGIAHAVDTVYVKDYGTNVQAAVNAAVGKTLVFPDNGVYTVSKPVALPSNITVEGHGSTLLTARNSTTPSKSDSVFQIDDKSNVNVSGLIFNGNVDAQNKWSQWRHEITVTGASDNVTLDNNTYVNLIGDGVYIGVGQPTNVDVTDSTFQGAHKNRNGVSIVAGTGVTVSGNTFDKMSRTDMPGAVDVEPNSASQVIKNVTIDNNTITGGPKVVDKYQYGITYNNHSDASADNVVISNNDISGQFYTGAGVIFINQPTPSRGTNLLATGNKVHDLTLDKSNGLELDYGVHAAVTNNQVTNVGWGIQSWKACLTDSSGNVYTNTPNGGLVDTSSTC